MESTLALGVQVNDAVVRLLAWRAVLPDEFFDQTAVFAVGILVLLVRREPRSSPQRARIDLANWVLSEEARLRELGETRSCGLIRLSALFAGLKRDKWCELVRPLLIGRTLARPSRPQEKLDIIAKRITDFDAPPSSI